MQDLIEQPANQDKDSQNREGERLAQAWRELLRAIGEFFRGGLGRSKPWRERAEAQFADAEQRVVDEGRRAAEATDQFVRAKPWHALGIAAGVAFLIGALMRRR